MNIHEAYQIAKEHEYNQDAVLKFCVDIGDKWAFLLRRKGVLGLPITVGGLGYTAVDKQTGEVAFMGTGFDAVETINKGKKINIAKLKIKELMPSTLGNRIKEPK